MHCRVERFVNLPAAGHANAFQVVSLSLEKPKAYVGPEGGF